MSQISNDGEKYDIFNFLEEHIVEKGQMYTHTSMGKPHGAYFIKDSEIDIFYQLYEKAIFDSKDLHITEKHDEIGPMLVDLDFKYELETFDRHHNEIHIRKIVELYINEICNLFNIEKNDKRLHCFVFERDQIYKTKGITKDGIHLMFPKIVSYPQEQYYIRENVLKKIGEILKDLPLTNIMSDVVDRSIIYNNGWLLYGSKKPKCDPYQITYLFDGLLNKINIEDYDFGPHSLPKFFAIRNKKDSEIISVRDDKKHLIETSTNKKKLIKPKQTTYINYDIDKIREFVSILNDERAEGYSCWLELGWALHNIDPNSQELLDIWIDFSKKSSKFSEGVCEKEWTKSKNEGLSLATIRYWAKLDNFEKYKEIVQNDVNKYIEISVKSQSNYDIAMVLYVMYKYEFKYCKNEWFVYRNHLWHREPDGISLRKKISTELVEQYMKLISYYNKISTNPNINMTDEEKDELKKKSKSPFEISTKLLKTSSFKDCIMKECKELFYDKDFVDKLDSNPYLLSFKNGIYDLKKGELRDGRPDDHIEMSTEIEKIDFDESSEYWDELKGFLDTVFFEEEMRDYFLTYFASCLQGHNAEEKIRIWNGQGCHAYDTDIMMYSGLNKKVQDIVVGDELMGDDSTPRKVLDLKRGFSTMYKLTTIKGETFTVNDDHILCLIKNNEIIEIKVKDYLLISDENKNKKYYLYKNGLNFNEINVPVDPYKIGHVLCDENYDNKDILIEILNLNFDVNKHIPDIYKFNSKENRLKILAGIIDSIGNYNIDECQYEISIKNENLIDDILYVSRSLGFSCFKNNFNLIIYGNGIEEIPVLLERKKSHQRIKNKNSSYYSFTIDKVEDNYYYGFEIDKNHRYLMGDFTVTHNSNGKSKILELFVHSLGNYSIKFPITMLTGKRAASNAATPEMARAKGKRFGYLEEPSEGEKIDAGYLKELTGGDKITARPLHKDPIDFKPQFKLALLCNEIPKVPPNDSGTWRRMEVIEFKSRFCENPKEPNEFPIDKQLSEKLKNWKELFMALLLDVYYEKYKKTGIKVPMDVIKFTLEYQKQCDLYTDFIHDNIDDTKEDSDVIDITQLYDEFKVWYEDTFSNHKYPSKIEFRNYLKKKYSSRRITTKNIKGFKFKVQYEKKNNMEINIMQGY
jgi:hypothetical protein